MNHSCSASMRRTKATILAESIPDLHTVCRIMPVQVIFLFSDLTIRMADE